MANQTEINKCIKSGSYIYKIFHICMIITAIYLAQCNGLNIFNLLIIIIFPYIYIIYSIILHNGICQYTPIINKLWHYVNFNLGFYSL